jgi:hypothetical protein
VGQRLEDHQRQDLAQSRRDCCLGHGRLRCATACLAAVLHIGSHDYPDHAEASLHQWITGTNFLAGSPVLVLRSFDHVGSAWSAFVDQRRMNRLPKLRTDTLPRIRGEQQQQQSRRRQDASHDDDRVTAN